MNLIPRLTLSFSLVATLLVAPVSAEPTESRVWTSTAGTKVTASALQMKSGKVQLKLETGKTIVVDVKKFVEADQEFLNEHFGVKTTDPPAAEAGEPKESGAAKVTDGLAHAIGEVHGPIDAGGGSTYFLYLPKSLRKDRKAPLLHVNDAGGGNANSVKKHIEGAELNGWVVVASVQSRNGPGHPDENHKHAKKVVSHVLDTLPVDDKRVYFTGMSGGGAMSFINAAGIKSAGAMPNIGYIPGGTNPKSGHYFITGGTTDYNRYLSARAVEVTGKKNAIHRFFAGGHSGLPRWMYAEGMAWLNGRYLEANARDSKLADERLDYEVAMIDWIKDLQSKEPHRAYYWCMFLTNEYGISGPNAAVLKPITTQLASDPICKRYADGIAAINEFSIKYYAPEGEGGGSKFKHTSSKIERASEKLTEELKGVPLLEQIASELGKPTVGR